MKPAPKVASPPPAPRADPPPLGNAAAILAVESKVRAARDETELLHLVANELRKLVGGRQAVVVKADPAHGVDVVCVSSLVLTDKDTPFVRWIAAVIRSAVADGGDTAAVTFDLPAYADRTAPETAAYPFPCMMWQPMFLVSGEIFAGVLIARERPWTEHDKKLAAREADVFGRIWQSLHGGRFLRPRRKTGRKVRWAVAVASCIAAAVPVPMTTLAPVEIIALKPQRVTAPIDGIVHDILVEPNRPVTAGQPILRLDDTTLRNRLLIAEQESAVARARFDRASVAAFTEDKARHELAQSRAELDLKSAERDYAAALLGRSVIHAERDGVLIYADKDRWLGRPVKTGERIMEIVAPGEIAARIEVPVSDAIVLAQRASVRLFLDASPLTSVSARLISEGYHAEPNSTQQLVYRLHAAIDGPGGGIRIGARGTAQLQGGYAPLAFYLLRRPISAIRQHIGL